MSEEERARKHVQWSRAVPGPEDAPNNGSNGSSEFDGGGDTDPGLRSKLIKYQTPMLQQLKRMQAAFSLVAAIFVAGGAGFAFLSTLARKDDVDKANASVQDLRVTAREHKMALEQLQDKQDRMGDDVKFMRQTVVSMAIKLGVPGLRGIAEKEKRNAERK